MLDFSADPWGTAMLGAGGIAVLGFVIVALALLFRTSRSAGGWVLALGCLGFLGSAAGGTAARIRETPPAPEGPPPPPVVIKADHPPAADTGPGPGTPTDAKAEPAADGATPTDVVPPVNPLAETGGETGDETGAAAADGDAKADDAGEAKADDTGDAKAADDGDAKVPVDVPPTEPPPTEPPPTEPPPTEPPPTVAMVEPPADLAPDALPEDPAARDKEIDERIRTARKVTSDRAQCEDLEAVARAWAGLAAVPTEIESYSIDALTAKLEKCRRKVHGGRSYALRQERIEAREAWVEKLSDRLGVKVIGTLRGASTDKLRAHGSTLDVAAIDKLLEEGLRVELEGLGFVEVVFTNGKDSRRLEFTPPHSTDLVSEQMKAWGLGSRLSRK